MHTFPCPHCGADLAHIRSLVGNSTKCPHCDEQFVMPETSLESTALMPTSTHSPSEIHPRAQYAVPSQPTIIVAGNREPRLEAGGWFTRAFSATCGVVLALLLFSALICGGCLVVVNNAIDASAKREDRERLTNTARPVGSDDSEEDVGSNQLPPMAPKSRSPDTSPPSKVAGLKQPPPRPEREFRMWTTADGKFNTEAQFLSKTAGKVKLKKRDQSIVEVRVDLLSDADHEYIRIGISKGK